MQASGCCNDWQKRQSNSCQREQFELSSRVCLQATNRINKPVAFVCACVAGIGLLIIGRSTFLTMAYGRGNMEAGNFNRCWYSITRDPQTGRMVREWDVIGESTEDTIADRLDMWFVGVSFVVVGAGIYAAVRAYGQARHEF